MLDIENTIDRHADTTRCRREKIAHYKAASSLNPVRKVALFREAYPITDWPLDELAIIGVLLSGIGVLGTSILGA